MKKTFFIILSLLIISNVYAETIIVWEMPDGKLRHTICPNYEDKDRCMASGIEGNPNFANAVSAKEYKREDLPKDNRDMWIKKNGKIKVDKYKINKIKEESLINNKVKELIELEKRQEAIKILKSEGSIKE